MQPNDDILNDQSDAHILHPSSRSLFRFWETMRAEETAPRRAALDLRQIRQLVPHLFIGEYAPKVHIYRWRLAGTGICDLFQRELTGTDMLSGWDNFESDIIARFLAGTRNNHQPAVLRFRLTTDRDQIIGAEMIAVPIIAADGITTHLFGGLFPFREIWSLDYAEITRFELSAARHIWTESLPRRAAAAEPAAPARRNFQVIPGGLSQS